MIGRTAWLALIASVVVLSAARLLVIDEQAATVTLPTTVQLPGTPFSQSPSHLPAVCVFRTWTGVSCPTCGLTRSFIALAHGRWREAWHYHPVAFLLFSLTCLNVPLRLRELRPSWFSFWGWNAIGSTRRWELAAWGTAFALTMAVGASRWLTHS